MNRAPEATESTQPIVAESRRNIVTYDGNTVRIARKFPYRWLGETTFPVRDVVSLQYKTPGLFTGWLTIKRKPEAVIGSRTAYNYYFRGKRAAGWRALHDALQRDIAAR